ncbi:hypothetical protein OSB04_002085 [Centaurea solstitialis]|uniref:Uncharacterized protein n=1 Tax=Centaurea solstitialis TaxID=347529 RepID=A0AA38WUQ2_9ASTR|nr:hypothetical protein OSB04_002085 [Centaurea solstitialis]
MAVDCRRKGASTAVDFDQDNWRRRRWHCCRRPPLLTSSRRERRLHAANRGLAPRAAGFVPQATADDGGYCFSGYRPVWRQWQMSKSVVPFYTPKESLRLINGKWKLTGQNFPVWKMHLDNVLSAQDESDVMSILIFSISPEFMGGLRDKSCHEVVKDIENQLGFYKHTCKLLIMKEILSLKLKKNQSVKDHLINIRRLFKCLTRLGYKMAQEELMHLMWYSLPKEICDTASAYMKEPRKDVAMLHEDILASLEPKPAPAELMDSDWIDELGDLSCPECGSQDICEHSMNIDQLEIGLPDAPERRNRTLLDMVRSMMCHSTLPVSFWGHALETTTHIRNRAPIKSIEKTPYELWKGKKPKMSFLKIWGCEVYVKRPTSEKLKPKSDKCFFVRYPKTTVGYYFYNPEENKVFVARNGKFLEEKFLSSGNTREDVDLQVVDEENTTPTVEPEIQHESVEPQSEPIEKVQTQDLRRSTRVRQEPDRYLGFLVSQVGGDLNEPTSYGEAVSGSESEQWQKAMKAEMQSMYDNQVWELTDLPQHCRAVERKWVFKKKTDMDGNVNTFKARLVGKGFTQTHGIDYDETFSPVAMLKSIRILMAISAYFNYEIWQMDVKTAFLNGKLIEDIYMEQPEGFEDPENPNKVCKLLKSIYGLKQASRSWNLHFDERIKEFDFAKSEFEPCVYTKFSGSDAMKDLGEAAYILGIKIYRNRSKRLIGLSQSTPDVAYSVSVTSRYQQNPGEPHWVAVKNILKYLRRTKDMFLVFGGSEDEISVTGYSDASFQTDRDDFRSQSGYVFTLNGGAISWKSSKRDTIADSTTEAEYIAASDAAKEAVWLRNFLSDLRVVASVSRPINIFCDNSGAVAQAKEPREHHKSRHVLRKYHLIREIIGRGDVRICKIPTEDNVADPLTKPLARVKHEAHASSIVMQYLDTSS